MKKCKKCQQEKDESEFHKKLNSLSARCKYCTKEDKDERKKANPELFSQQSKLWRENNKEKLREKVKLWRKNNKEKVRKANKKFREENQEYLKLYRNGYIKSGRRKETNKQWREQNLEKAKAIDQKYRQKNRSKISERLKILRSKPEFKEKHNAYLSEYRRKRSLTDPSYKIVKNLRRRFLHAIKGNNKSVKTMELIGCKVEDLIKHLENLFLPEMSWENYGFSGWHIDHKIPCNSFDLSDPDQQKRCFHFTNLQPLWWKDNIAKGSLECFPVSVANVAGINKE